MVQKIDLGYLLWYKNSFRVFIMVQKIVLGYLLWYKK